MFEPTCARIDAATTIFNLPDYRVISAETLAFGQRRICVESTFPPGCPQCGVISIRRHSRRWQRVRDILVAGATEVLWSKRRWFCDEWLCERKTFTEATAQVPARARSTRRLRDALVEAVIGSGRAAAETAAAFGVSWWLVQRALDSAVLTLPDVDALSPRMLGIDEHRYRSVRFFQNPSTKAWTRYEPWMSTIVDLDTGQVLGVVDVQPLVERAAQPETNRLWRTVCRWSKEIEVLIVTGATTAKVEANNTAIKNIKRTGRGFTNAENYRTRILLRSAARTAA
ncbi:transposase [Arthrobacter monumenti]